MLEEARFYGKTAVGAWQALRQPLAVEPEELIRGQLRNRERNFLEMARTVVFGRAGNPFHQMFQLAGCGFEDLQEMVERDGLETALAALNRAGVYLTHDEFKGKRPIERGGRTIAAESGTFINPQGEGLLETSSGGSRSEGTRTPSSLSYIEQAEARVTVLWKEFGLLERSWTCLNPILPSFIGIGPGVSAALRKKRVERWFAVGGPVTTSWHYRTITNLLVVEMHMLGLSTPFPSYLPADDFSPVARWLSKRKAQGASCVLKSMLSPGVRVAAAATELGLDIRGTLFLVNSEALTDAKREVIEAAGCEVYTDYGSTELGQVGHGCRQMKDGNRIHIWRDAVAMITYPKPAPLSGVEVNSLRTTTLLPSSPFFLINVEMDDAGVIEPARCDCSFSRFGFTEQLRDIYSYGKLTGQGMTLVGTELVAVLEDALPSRFGGGPSDYQLVEQEGEAQTLVTLRVSPRVGLGSTDAIRDFFFAELRRLYGGALAYRHWTHSGGFQVQIAEPLMTRRGKVLPLHLLGSAEGSPE